MFRPKTAFQSLKGKTFKTYVDALEAMADIRRQNLRELAPDMGPEALLQIALDLHWAEFVSGGGVVFGDHF